jgi:hypothetical protein
MHDQVKISGRDLLPVHEIVEGVIELPPGLGEGRPYRGSPTRPRFGKRSLGFSTTTATARSQLSSTSAACAASPRPGLHAQHRRQHPAQVRTDRPLRALSRRRLADPAGDGGPTRGRYPHHQEVAAKGIPDATGLQRQGRAALRTTRSRRPHATLWAAFLPSGTATLYRIAPGRCSVKRAPRASSSDCLALSGTSSRPWVAQSPCFSSRLMVASWARASPSSMPHSPPTWLVPARSLGPGAGWTAFSIPTLSIS